MRAATLWRRSSSTGGLFQSTQPMRAATTGYPEYLSVQMLFQSTQPMRAATFVAMHHYSFNTRFQSTQPMRAATEKYGADITVELISIHAAHAGCDALCVCRAVRVAADFNPRSPCGLRQSMEVL